MVATRRSQPHTTLTPLFASLQSMFTTARRRYANAAAVRMDRKREPILASRDEHEATEIESLNRCERIMRAWRLRYGVDC